LRKTIVPPTEYPIVNSINQIAAKSYESLVDFDAAAHAEMINANTSNCRKAQQTEVDGWHTQGRTA
jgi:hypothetical protein